MRTLVWTVAGIGLVAGIRAGGVAPPARVAFAHVTLIDGTDRPPRADVTVMVTNGRIESIRPGAAPIKRGTRIIDGHGRFLIPGLWDMHAHVVYVGEPALPLYVAWGVTTIRDLGGSIDSLRAYRAHLATAAIPAPRVLASRTAFERAAWLTRVLAINIPGFEFPDPGWVRFPHLGISSAAEGRRGVDSLADLGVDWIKIRTVSDREQFLAIIAEATKRGLPVASHLPSDTTLVEAAADAGIRSFEHFGWADLLAHRDSAGRARFYEILRRNRTWIDPTIVSGLVPYLADSIIAAVVADSDGRAVEANRYTTARLRTSFRKDEAIRKFGRPEGTADPDLTILAEMHRAGIGMLAGTDLGALMVYPGMSLHDELALLVEKVGLTPLEALQAATRNAALASSALDSLGTLEPGKVADAVLLAADPLVAITNSRRIEGVMVRGEYLDAPTRTRVLDAVRRRRDYR